MCGTRGTFPGMSWSLFDRTPPSETARYTIKFVPFHPCVRRERRHTQTVRVVGDRAAREMRQQIRAAGGEVVRCDRRGR